MDKALTEHICKIVENEKEKDSFYEEVANIVWEESDGEFFDSSAADRFQGLVDKYLLGSKDFQAGVDCMMRAVTGKNFPDILQMVANK